MANQESGASARGGIFGISTQTGERASVRVLPRPKKEPLPMSPEPKQEPPTKKSLIERLVKNFWVRAALLGVLVGSGISYAASNLTRDNQNKPGETNVIPTPDIYLSGAMQGTISSQNIAELPLSEIQQTIPTPVVLDEKTHEATLLFDFIELPLGTSMDYKKIPVSRTSTPGYTIEAFAANLPKGAKIKTSSLRNVDVTALPLEANDGTITYDKAWDIIMVYYDKSINKTVRIDIGTNTPSPYYFQLNPNLVNQSEKNDNLPPQTFIANPNADAMPIGIGVTIYDGDGINEASIKNRKDYTIGFQTVMGPDGKPKIVAPQTTN